VRSNASQSRLLNAPAWAIPRPTMSTWLTSPLAKK
jgi:hypothetical protein